MDRLTLPEALGRIQPADQKAVERARLRQSMLTKPAGALGVLEALSIRLAGMFGDHRPSIDGKAVVVAVADHGVTAQGVSGYPQAVTAQMALNFLAGGAAVSVMADLLGVRQIVVDAGIASDILPPHSSLRSHRMGWGTGDISLGPAMSREQAILCLETGIGLAVELASEQGVNLIATGDMGIGNTTTSSAVTAAITGHPPESTTGAGTGRTLEQIRDKSDVVKAALQINGPAPDDPLGVLAKVGGFEIGVLAGVMLGGAAMRCAVVLDGFISGASALIASGLCGTATDYMIASHRSAEQGHAVVLTHLGLSPLLDLQMRLGEGTGAVLAIPIIEAAAACLTRMATFQQAGVSNRPAEPS
ncbi:MAG: nicotinate-nucleotide--dimethylbenzimidazole phosphoribosyltransferase [Actinomycetia bacterium]|nr:nicotinate-nucleotide--dimethylbenzimidazole phosphoribosyltransferase [Actinomycetes bacterium]